MKKIIVATAISMFAVSSLFGAGTQAGTDINNTATLSYSAGGVAQPDKTSNTDSFKVDKKVDMVLVTSDTNQTEVTPGQQDRITNYEFKNEGNENQYFKFTVANLANDKEADYNSDKDNDDVNNLEIKCTYKDADGNDQTADWATDFTIQVKQDTNATCQVRADIKTAADGGDDQDIMNVELLATAVTDSSGNTAETESDHDTQDTVDVVLADGVSDDTLGSSNQGKGDTAKDGKEAARSGYRIVTPVLDVTKTSCVVSDPVNGTTKPKRIPGAVIRYMFDVHNTGTGDVSDANITDSIDSNLLTDDTKDSAKKDENQTSCTCSTEPSTNIKDDTTVDNQDVTIEHINVANGDKHTCVSIETEVK